MCVHVCVLLFLNYNAEADCFILFQYVPQTAHLETLRVRARVFVCVRAHARASVPLFQRWKPCASAPPRKRTDV